MGQKISASLKKFGHFVNRQKTWLVLFACVVGFLGLAEEVFHHEIMKGDIVGYEFVSKYLISDGFTPIAKGITHLGGVYGIGIVTAVLLLVLKEKREKILVLVNLFLVVALNQCLKQLVQRPRPTEYRIIDQAGYSFPSGHSMVSMAFYGYLIYLIYQHIGQSLWKWIGIAALGALILSIGVSRIYLGVHYTSDVLAGFLLSAAYLILFVKVTKRKKE